MQQIRTQIGNSISKKLHTSLLVEPIYSIEHNILLTVHKGTDIQFNIDDQINTQIKELCKAQGKKYTTL